MRCVSSDENAQLQWYSIDITDDTQPISVPSKTNGVLEVDLHELSATNLIDYYCTASNSFGVSRTVPFRAYGPPCMFVLCINMTYELFIN